MPDVLYVVLYMKDQTSPLSPADVMPFIASRIRACLNALRLYVFPTCFSCRVAMKLSQAKSAAASSAALMASLIAKDDGVCAPVMSSAFSEPLLLVLHLSEDAPGKANALCACNYTVFA